MGTNPEYEVKLYNVTHFTDVGRLSAYFVTHIASGFELEDLDTCTPNSWTSNVWKLTVHMQGAQNFCEQIFLIICEVGRRLQCLHCGNLGHSWRVVGIPLHNYKG